MINFDDDKLTRQKLESLGTLEGGIVFGKEETWEKLQARLDKKPARSIPWRYWLPAAAVLLIFVSVVARYNRPVAATALRLPHASQAITAHHSSSVATRPARVASAQPRQEAGQTTNALVAVQSDRSPLPGRAFRFSVTHMQASRAESKADTIPPVVAVAIASPSMAASYGLKMVHINDLDPEESVTQNPPATATTTLAASARMRVVHINDLGEDRNQKMLEDFESKTHDDVPDFQQHTASNYKNTNPHNPFHKLIHSTQN